jgi:voltage-gated potassium channel
MNARAQAAERAFAVPVMVAALLVIPLLVLESRDLGGAWPTVLSVANWAIWLAFFAEAVVLLRLVDGRWAWLRGHPLDAAIVVVSFPPLPTPGVIRLLRLLRLLRLPGLARRVFTLEGLRYVSVLAVVTVIGGGTAFAQAENKSFMDGLYWAMSTMTTVGYGDLTPTTNAGKVLAIAVMLIGIGFVAILTGAVAERFVHRDVAKVEEEVEAVGATEADVRAELRDVMERLARIEARL